MTLAPRSAWFSRHVSNAMTLATAILLVVSVTINVALARRLRAYGEPTSTQPAPGTFVPSLPVTTLKGRAAEIRFDRRTILYYFSPVCGWCQKNWLNVKALIAGTQDRYRFVGLSTSADVAAYLVERGLTFEVYTGLNPEAARLLHFGGTPHTVVVGASGLVEQAWSGAYGDRQHHAIENALAVVLPGLKKPGS